MKSGQRGTAAGVRVEEAGEGWVQLDTHGGKKKKNVLWEVREFFPSSLRYFLLFFFLRNNLQLQSG